jgi:hypothetical protein
MHNQALGVLLITAVVMVHSLSGTAWHARVKAPAAEVASGSGLDGQAWPGLEPAFGAVSTRLLIF